jgi:uncharacterized protein YbaR (Trm112 family)
MKEELLDYLICPECGSHLLRKAAALEGREIKIFENKITVMGVKI